MSEAFQALTTDYRLSCSTGAGDLHRGAGPGGRAGDPGRRPPGHQAGVRHADRGPAMTTDPALVIDTAIGPATSCTGSRWRSNAWTRSPDGGCVPASASAARWTAAAPARATTRSWPCLDLTGQGRGPRRTLRFDHATPVHTPLRLRIVDPCAAVRAAAVRPAAVDPGRDPRRRGGAAGGAGRLAGCCAPGCGPGQPRCCRPGHDRDPGPVRTGAAPVRWPRLTAVGPGTQAVGWAHGDERGRVPVVITDTGTLPPPAPSTIDSTSSHRAGPGCAAAGRPARPARPLRRSRRRAGARGRPPRRSPADLDNAVLRGTATPAGYVAEHRPRPDLTVPVGGSCP